MLAESVPGTSNASSSNSEEEISLRNKDGAELETFTRLASSDVNALPVFALLLGYEPYGLGLNLRRH